MLKILIVSAAILAFCTTMLLAQFPAATDSQEHKDAMSAMTHAYGNSAWDSWVIRPKAVCVATLTTRAAGSFTYETTIQTLQNEKYKILSANPPAIEAADNRPTFPELGDPNIGAIEASGKPFRRPNTCAVTRIALMDTPTELTVQAIFANYPGCVFDTPVKDQCASFMKEIKKSLPVLTSRVE